MIMIIIKLKINIDLFTVLCVSIVNMLSISILLLDYNIKLKFQTKNELSQKKSTSIQAKNLLTIEP